MWIAQVNSIAFFEHHSMGEGSEGRGSGDRMRGARLQRRCVMECEVTNRTDGPLQVICHAFIHSYICYLTLSFARSLTHSLTHTLARSLVHPHNIHHLNFSPLPAHACAVSVIFHAPSGKCDTSHPGHQWPTSSPAQLFSMFGHIVSLMYIHRPGLHSASGKCQCER